MNLSEGGGSTVMNLSEGGGPAVMNLSEVEVLL